MYMYTNLSHSNMSNSSSSIKADSANAKANRANNDFQKLQSNFDKACLINQALLEIVQDKLGVSDSEIEAKILEIDLRDGSADGKMGGSITVCPGCEREVNSKKGSCFYCGAELTKDHKFEL